MSSWDWKEEKRKKILRRTHIDIMCDTKNKIENDLEKQLKKYKANLKKENNYAK